MTKTEERISKSGKIKIAVVVAVVAVVIVGIVLGVTLQGGPPGGAIPPTPSKAPSFHDVTETTLKMDIEYSSYQYVHFYKIYWSSSSDGPWNVLMTIAADSEKVTIPLTGMGKGATYYFRFHAIASSGIYVGMSKQSPLGWVTMEGDEPVPPTITPPTTTPPTTPPTDDIIIPEFKSFIADYDSTETKLKVVVEFTDYDRLLRASLFFTVDDMPIKDTTGALLLYPLEKVFGKYKLTFELSPFIDFDEVYICVRFWYLDEVNVEVYSDYNTMNFFDYTATDTTPIGYGLISCAVIGSLTLGSLVFIERRHSRK